jgi:hypothetical protein
MLLAYPAEYAAEYAAEKVLASKETLRSVLGKSHFDASQYSEEESKLFGTYHQRFKLGSKPAAHIEALSNLDDDDISLSMPESFESLTDAVIKKLSELPE